MLPSLYRPATSKFKCVCMLANIYMQMCICTCMCVCMFVRAHKHFTTNNCSNAGTHSNLTILRHTNVHTRHTCICTCILTTTMRYSVCWQLFVGWSPGICNVAINVISAETQTTARATKRTSRYSFSYAMQYICMYVYSLCVPRLI